MADVTGGSPGSDTRPAAASTCLRAGAGRALITVPEHAYPIDGFAAEHDPLAARVVLVEDGATRIAIAVIEQTSIAGVALGRMTEIISHEAGVAPEDVLLCASHTFSAPHLHPAEPVAPQERKRSDMLGEAVDDAVRRATTDAVRTLRPARWGSGLGMSAVNVNRDVRTADGWWLGTDDTGESDKSVTVVRIDDDAGRPLAVLFNYAVQSSVMLDSLDETGNKLVTADLAGAAACHVERWYENTVALFLVGAAGDQAPFLQANRHRLDRDGRTSRADVGSVGHLLVDLLGERLGAEVVRVCEEIDTGTPTAPALSLVSDSVTVDAQVAPASLRDIRPTTTYSFIPDGKVDVPVWVLRIGDVAVAGTQAELVSRTGLEIKRQSPFAHTMVVTMVNGAAKYLADAQSYDRISYEAMNSRYARGSAEIVAARIGEILDGTKR